MNDWVKALINLTEEKEGKCPKCGRKNLDYGYVILNQENQSGYGAVWCNDCRHAFCLSRIKLNGNENENKILKYLHKDLVFCKEAGQ